MTYGARIRRWPTVVLAVAFVVLFLASAFGAAGIIKIQAGGTAVNPVTAAPENGSSLQGPSSHLSAADCGWCSGAAQVTCQIQWTLGTVATLGVYALIGPGCDYSSSSADVTLTNLINSEIAANNTAISSGDFLNITNAEVANLNATSQELLSYFESRSESIVPYFLNTSWSSTVYDQIAIDSGLVPAIEGMELAFAHQQFQDWNATAAT